MAMEKLKLAGPIVRLNIQKIARQLEIVMVDPATGEETHLRRRYIPQLESFRQAAYAYTVPMSQNPEAFAVITYFDGQYGLEVSKNGANEMHIIYKGEEIGTIPAATAPGVAPGRFAPETIEP